ncbi:FlgL Flagellin and related hook-associated proteins [Rhabdaerophilaceae bacterium]
MSVVFNAATAANVNILRTTNELFQTSQKRVATGKSIFGAADNAARYTMSQTMLSRSKNIDSVNNNISIALKTLESTDVALKQVRSLLQQMNDMATQALAAGSTPSIKATPTANIGDTTLVAGYVVNERLSITNDDGRNFTFTFPAPIAGAGSSNNVSWGQVANALNAANIGVQAKFVPNGANTSGVQSYNIVFESTDGKSGFSIDGSSARNVVDDLGGINSGYDSTYAIAKFANGTAIPSGWSTTTPYGLRFGTGGQVTQASSIASASANSSISFVGTDGVARTWSTTTAKTNDQVATEINAINAGVRAEFTNGGLLRLRKLDGTAMVVLNGSGSFDPTANGRLNAIAGNPYTTGAPIAGSTNTDEAARLGAQFESYKTEITAVINNNVVQAGRNLLKGQGMNVILNEFAANPIAIAGENTTTAGNLALTTTGTSWTLAQNNIVTSVGQVQIAMGTVDKLAAQFGNYSSFIRERYDLNREFSSNLKALGDDLVAADVAEESAKLTALQTQQQFAVQAFSAGSQNAQSLLRLLG